MSKVMVAIVSFGINSGAYMAEILRAGIGAVDWGQTEAGRSLGLSRAQTMAYIILPQAVKNILPAYANEFIVLIKETAVVGYIALQDLTMMAGIIKSQTYEAFFPLFIAAVIYLSLTIGLTKLFGMMERRLGASDRR
jgi:ABC-type amino acid transport system permease subunit